MERERGVSGVLSLFFLSLSLQTSRDLIFHRLTRTSGSQDKFLPLTFYLFLSLPSLYVPSESPHHLTGQQLHSCLSLLRWLETGVREEGGGAWAAAEQLLK